MKRMVYYGSPFRTYNFFFLNSLSKKNPHKVSFNFVHKTIRTVADPEIRLVWTRPLELSTV